MIDSEILNYHELSKFLKRSVSSLRHDVMFNRIPYIKLNEGRSAQVRFRRTDIDAWLAAKVTFTKGRGNE